MLNKKNIILLCLIIFILSPILQAEEFKSPKSFTEYIYQNYAAENFNKVYDNFAVELKKVLKKEDYLEFQKKNFKKYNLKYTEIKVAEAKKIKFGKIKEKFDYADDFGEYYQLDVSYLLKFDRFGSREKRSEKIVYLRKINEDFQIFWDYENALADDKSVGQDDQDE